MKKIILFSIVGFFAGSCFMGSDPEMNIKKITSDFWIFGSFSDHSYSIIRSTELNPTGGAVIIEENIVDISYNDDFIVVRRHPNYESVIGERLFGAGEDGDYLIENPADTVYLSSDDSIYKKGDNWYHTSNGWSPPDSLNPYKSITIYHIIDLRRYKSSDHDSYDIHSYENENEFIAKKKELNIPEKLTIFEFIGKSSEVTHNQNYTK